MTSSSSSSNCNIGIWIVYTLGVTTIAIINVVFVILFIIAFNYYLINLPKETTTTTLIYVPPNNPVSEINRFDWSRFYSDNMYSAARFASVRFEQIQERKEDTKLILHTLQSPMKVNSEMDERNVIHTETVKKQIRLMVSTTGLYFLEPFAEYAPSNDVTIQIDYNINHLKHFLPNGTSARIAIVEESNYLQFIDGQPVMLLADEEVKLSDGYIFEYKFTELNEILTEFAIIMYFQQEEYHPFHIDAYSVTLKKTIPNYWILDKKQIISSCNLYSKDCYVPWGYNLAIETMAAHSDQEHVRSISFQTLRRSGFVRFILVVLVLAVPIAFDSLVVASYFMAKRKGFVQWEGTGWIVTAGNLFNGVGSERTRLI
jgi:hypothetical protein